MDLLPACTRGEVVLHPADVLRRDEVPRRPVVCVAGMQAPASKARATAASVAFFARRADGPPGSGVVLRLHGAHPLHDGRGVGVRAAGQHLAAEPYGSDVVKPWCHARASRRRRGGGGT